MQEETPAESQIVQESSCQRCRDGRGWRREYLTSPSRPPVFFWCLPPSDSIGIQLSREPRREWRQQDAVCTTEAACAKALWQE